MSATPESLLTRRNLLKAGFGVAALAALPAIPGCSAEGGAGTGQPATDTLPNFVFQQPPVRSSQFGLLDTSLDVRVGMTNLGTQTVTTDTYEGAFPGPTLRVRAGDTLRIRLTNNLGPNLDPVPPDINTPHHFNTTNLHTHGLHVSPNEPSDNIFVQVEPQGGVFQYEYLIPANHPAGTFYYHPHSHGASSVQLFGGMAGALIVEGEIDQVPEIAVAADVVLVINELNINANGVTPTFTTNGVFPLTQRLLPVNGRLVPTIRMAPGEVQRWRVINGTVRVEIPLSLDGHQLNVIARDGITLPQVTPVAVETLAASNRSDILVRASNVASLYALRKGALTHLPNVDPEEILAWVEVTGDRRDMALPTTLPTPASLPDITTAELTGFRTLTFAVGPGGPAPNFPNFTINGVRFNPNMVNQPVNLGAVEEWTLVNNSNVDHPFHIHINPFQVMSINGVPLPRPEWHDTVTIPANGGIVVIRTRFEDFTGKFVLHCHILQHEDLGMMQVVEVT